ncbi:pyridoxamine 5'-phosphate oxidase [Streptomyces showdoensis]|uniref:Pyridoxamine 5'-phosphate oxidase n=1 Tax=Streptomyces showdoensis TaxID=68268 RepID=A0A2P2GMH2_STREW|nr:pyridoxamine 5'-phosphate oxidase [Streptomyces showdoensis]KKZ72707.1 pyridoxamine 5'-phosphate oxidase [Streptomyces showdoensis]
MNADGPPARLRRALAAHTTLSLAYADEDGPGACAVLYAVTGTGALVFLTARSTRHGAALARQAPGARVAFTAHRDAQQWSSLTGLQGRGPCERASGPALAAARAAYARRFPFVATAGRLAQALSRADHWVIHPTWLRLVDNSRGFGHRTEWAA